MNKEAMKARANSAAVRRTKAASSRWADRPDRGGVWCSGGNRGRVPGGLCAVCHRARRVVWRAFLSAAGLLRGIAVAAGGSGAEDDGGGEALCHGALHHADGGGGGCGGGRDFGRDGCGRGNLPGLCERWGRYCVASECGREICGRDDRAARSSFVAGDDYGALRCRGAGRRDQRMART